LAERYARSEISVDEYHERLANLQDPSGGSDLCCRLSSERSVRVPAALKRA
jgi:hypothetical protein